MRRPSPHPGPRLCSGLLVGCVIVASLAATAASAADLPVPAAAPPVAYHPPIYDWTGIYVGGHVGGGWMNDTVTTLATTALQPTGTVTKVAPMGVLGGAQAGFNVEFAPVVVGFEGTWTATSLTGSQQIASLIALNGQQSTDAMPWLATATGRIGYAANDLLFYVKGGGAWARVEYTQTVTIGGGTLLTQQTLTDNRTGFVVGGGFEYGMNENLSIKIEYDYLGFGAKNYTFNNLSGTSNIAGNPPPHDIPVGAFPFSVKSQLQMLTAGVNYRFTWR